MDAVIEASTRAATVDVLLAEGTAVLAAAGMGTPRLDAELLLAAACGLDRTALYARGGAPLLDQCAATFRTFLSRRVQREPLQYIVGRQEFWSLDFTVTPDVLVPRPETELLVELALALLSPRFSGLPIDGCAPRYAAKARRLLGVNGSTSAKKDPKIRSPRVGPVFSGAVSRGCLGENRQFLSNGETAARPLLCDVGTGSGCIAVALARELPSTEVWALDVSPDALVIAEANARQHGVAERIRFLHSDLFAAVSGQRFDVIVSNPPYLAADDLTLLQPEVGFEPRAALAGGADGLDIIRRLLAAAPDHLADGGWLLMEIGAAQAAAVDNAARAAGFNAVTIRTDYAGLPRVLMARR